MSRHPDPPYSHRAKGFGLLAKDANGYWTGFVEEARDGDLYHFWVTGAGSSGYKRDPYARELVPNAPFPNCSCIIRSAVGRRA